MRSIFRFAAVGAVAVLVALGATAQEPGAGAGRGGRAGGFGRGMGGGMMGGAMLLNRADVQKELNLTDEQKTKLQATRAAMREEMQGQMANLRDMTPEEQQKKMAELQANVDKKIAAILTAEQYKRYKELALQQEGGRALLRADLQKELGISAAQKTRLEGVERDSQRERQMLMQGIRDASADERQAMLQKLQKMTTDTDAKYVAVLTDVQKSKFEQMKGKKFEFQGGAPGFGGRGGGGGAGRGGPGGAGVDPGF